MRTVNVSNVLRGISKFAGALALTTLSACGSGGGSVDLQIGIAQGALSASGESAAIVITDRDGVKLTLSQAKVHLRDIELRLPAGVRCADVEAELAVATCHASTDDPSKTGDSGEDEIRIPGPFVVDLLTRTATPDLAAVKLPAVAYRRVDFRIDDAKNDELPAGDPLADHSWLLEAQLAPGSAATSVLVVLDFNEDLRIESPSGVTVSDGASLLLAFDVDAWLAGVSLGACVESGDVPISGGVVRIDEDTKGGGKCGDVEGQIKDGIKASGRLDHSGSDDGSNHG